MFKVLDAYMRPNGLANNLNLNLYRVYKNPNARDLYMKAQCENVEYIKKDLYEKMGDYELIDETPKVVTIAKSIIQIFKDSINDLKDWYSFK